MRKAYIHTDIEGVAGYVHYYSLSSSLWNFHHVQRMNRLLTREVEAAVRALKAEGIEEIYVSDSHGPAYNLNFEELDPICRILHGRPGRGPSWTPLLDSTFEAAVAIGMHAAAGTTNSVCNHSLWHLTDGEGAEHRLSELGMFIHLAARHGVPLVAVSGDQHICAEAAAMVGCEPIVVKESLALEFACSLQPDAACAAIERGVRAGMQRRAAVTIPKLTGPFRLNVSDRNPEVRALEEDETGEDLEAVMLGCCNRGYAKFGAEEQVDDRAWRWPDSLFKP